MAEFLQTYGIWIYVGVLFSLILWGRFRGRGMGCCGGHQPETIKVTKDEQRKP